ncbi:MAG: hypothetical protein IV090_17075 [Candidatus Sericytochromatia bacterium]|nr:hypothetical protein [Candidatus Sericytochromatia bacterium]
MLADLIWNNYIRPDFNAFQAGNSDANSISFLPIDLENPKIIIEIVKLAQEAIHVSAESIKPISLLRYCLHQANLAAKQEQRGSFWIHFWGFLLAIISKPTHHNILSERVNQDFLELFQEFNDQPHPQKKSLAAPFWLLAIRHLDNPSLIEALNFTTKIDPLSQKERYDWLKNNLFQHSHHVLDSTDSAFLMHLMAYLQPLYQAGSLTQQLRVSPWLIFALRKFFNSEPVIRAFALSMKNDSFVSTMENLDILGYSSVWQLFEQILQIKDPQSFRDDVFEKIIQDEQDLKRDITKKIFNDFFPLRPANEQKQLQILGVHAFVRELNTSSDCSFKYRYITQADDDTFCFIRKTQNGGKIWELPRKSGAKQIDVYAKYCELFRQKYHDLVQKQLKLDVFKKQRIQSAFEILCLPDSDLYFVELISTLLAARAQLRSGVATDVEVVAASCLQKFGCLAPEAVPDPKHDLQLRRLVDSLHRLSCPARLGTKTPNLSWLFMGELATVFLPNENEVNLANWKNYRLYLDQQAKKFIEGNVTEPANYWEQFDFGRPDDLTPLNALTEETFLRLLPYPFYEAELFYRNDLLQDLDSQSFFFYQPLNHELLETDTGKVKVPASFMTGTLITKADSAEWPFSTPRFKSQIALMGEMTRIYTDYHFIDQRNADYQNLQSAQAEQLKAEDQKLQAQKERDSVQHLIGVEKNLKDLIDDIKKVQTKALKLQNHVFPGTYGLMSMREEFQWLFSEEIWYLHHSGLSGKRQALKQSAAYFEDEKFDYRVKSKQIFEVSISMHRQSRDESDSPIPTFHSLSTDFASKWPSYILIIYAQGLYLSLPLLCELAKASRLANQRENWWKKTVPREWLEHEQKIYLLLKLLLHRSHSPKRSSVSGTLQPYLHLAQLAGNFLDARPLNERAEFPFLWHESATGDKHDISSIEKLLNHLNQLNDSDNAMLIAESVGEALLLDSHTSQLPVHLLAPLYRLVAEVFSPQRTDPNECRIKEIVISCRTQEWEIRLICDNHLPDSALREGDEAENSNLSGSIQKLADFLATKVPKVQTIEPDPDVLFWIRCFEQELPSSSRFKASPANMTEIGMILKSARKC